MSESLITSDPRWAWILSAWEASAGEEQVALAIYIVTHCEGNARYFSPWMRPLVCPSTITAPSVPAVPVDLPPSVPGPACL